MSHKENKYPYHVSGEGNPLVLLHGLFGTVSNWKNVIGYFSSKFKVITPILPVYAGDASTKSIEGIARYFEEFVDHHNLQDITLLGNSLGGHIALLYAHAHPENVQKMVLAGSSGLYERYFGGMLPNRNEKYVRHTLEKVFYDTRVVLDSEILEIVERINDTRTALRIVRIAKSAQRSTVLPFLHAIKTPALLIWGLYDQVTPPHVAHLFHNSMYNARLHFIDKCGHAPMTETPTRFNQLVNEFLIEK